MLTETLFTFLLVICFYFFISYLKEEKTKQLIYAGLFSGLTILCRPIAFFIPIFFSFFILLKHGKKIQLLIKHLLLLSGIVFIIISPWLIRNKIAYDHYFLSVIREHNLLNYQAAAVYAERFNHSLPQAQSILRWKTFREFKRNANKQPYEYAKYIEQEGIKVIFQSPGLFFKQHITGVANFFLRPTRSYIDIQLGHWGKGYDTVPKNYPIFKYLFENNSRLTIALVFFQLFILLIVYSTSITGLIYMKKEVGYFFSLLGISILIFANFNLSIKTESRFRVPIWPLIAVISAYGINYLKDKIRVKTKTANLF